jgi:hypothetical protein
MFKVETQVLPSIAEALGGQAKGRSRIQLAWEGTPLTIQMEIGNTGARLNLAITRMMKDRWQGGEFQEEADEMDEIDFEKEYRTPIETEVFIKQLKMTLWHNETRIQVSERSADHYGLPE